MWVFSLIGQLWRAIAGVPGGALLAELLAGALVVLMICGIAYKVLGDRWLPQTPRTSRLRSIDGDPWNAADRCARAGEYTEAAHWLYAAFLRSLVARVGIRLHPSKTAGDYVRDLRRLNQRNALEHFLPFVRAYEIIAYRDERCDAAGYARLRELAEPARQLHRSAA